MPNTLFGYVGGKARLSPLILAKLGRFDRKQYREPFFGGGAIGLHVMDHGGNDIWVNDRDIGIHCIWRCVKHFPEELKALVEGFKPSAEQFYTLKEFLLSRPVPATDDDVIRIGFSKLACHKLSFCQLGVMGALQGSPETLNKRWNPPYLSEKINTLHRWFTRRKVKITNADFSEVISDDSADALLYLDPPYYVKGGLCYMHSFEHGDHVRLSELLKATKHRWVMSYDDAWNIRQLYEGWTNIEVVNARYSVKVPSIGTELLISSQ